MAPVLGVPPLLGELSLGDFYVFFVLARWNFKTDANGNSKLVWVGLVFLRVSVPETSPTQTNIEKTS